MPVQGPCCCGSLLPAASPANARSPCLLSDLKMKMRMGLILSALEDFKAARVAADHGACARVVTPARSTLPKGQSSPLEIVGDILLFTQSPGQSLLRRAGVRDDFMTGVKPNAKARVGQRFDHDAIEFCHYRPFEPPWPVPRGSLARPGRVCRNATPAMPAGVFPGCFCGCLVRGAA